MRKLWSVVVVVAGSSLCACSSDADGETGNDGSGGSAGAAGSAGASAGTGGMAGGGTGGTGGSAGASGSGGMAGNAAACTATDVTGFTPSWTPPQAIYQDVCSEAEINAIVDGCYGTAASNAACSAALAANAACGACASTSELDSEHGAMIVYASRGIVDRNIHGCWAHADGDLSENGCGAKVKEMLDCAVTSCAGCLPVATTQALADLNTCAGQALQGPCSDRAQAAQTCTQSLSGPIADACPMEATDAFSTTAERYVRLFCGAAPP